MSEESSLTMVLGASPKTDRYSNIATRMLKDHGERVYALGRREGSIDDTPIVTDWPEAGSIDTVTLYMNPKNQEPYLDKIIALKPKRVIFNPGTENPGFYRRLRENGIEVEVACTLVMLRTGAY